MRVLIYLSVIEAKTSLARWRIPGDISPEICGTPRRVLTSTWSEDYTFDDDTVAVNLTIELLITLDKLPTRWFPSRDYQRVSLEGADDLVVTSATIQVKVCTVGYGFRIHLYRQVKSLYSPCLGQGRVSSPSNLHIILRPLSMFGVVIRKYFD